MCVCVCVCVDWDLSTSTYECYKELSDEKKAELGGDIFSVVVLTSNCSHPTPYSHKHHMPTGSSTCVARLPAVCARTCDSASGPSQFPTHTRHHHHHTPLPHATQLALVAAARSALQSLQAGAMDKQEARRQLAALYNDAPDCVPVRAPEAHTHNSCHDDVEHRLMLWLFAVEQFPWGVSHQGTSQTSNVITLLQIPAGSSRSDALTKSEYSNYPCG